MSQHPEFHQTSLKTDSVIKLNKIATILKPLILGEIGSIGNQLKEEVNTKFIQAFLL